MITTTLRRAFRVSTAAPLRRLIATLALAGAVLRQGAARNTGHQKAKQPTGLHRKIPRRRASRGRRLVRGGS